MLGSESQEALLDEFIDYDCEIPEEGLCTVLTCTRDKQFLYAPVLACTIDHLMAATETKRGGRYILPSLRLMSSDLVIDEMTIAEWEKIITKGDKPVLSGYLLTECKGMISFLMRKQKINNDNIRHIIITDIGKQAAKRDRVYTKGELRKVLDYCLDQTFPIETRLPLLIIMITGCRMSEVATAMRSDFEVDERIWTVPRVNSKNKAKIVRPIPEFIIPMFKELFEAQGNEKPLLVTNRGGCISPPWLSIKLNSLRDLIGVEGMILHSFRHTLTTQYANLNIPPHLAEEQCGHKLSGVMAIYNRAEYLPEQLEAMEKYVAWIQE